MRKTTVNAIRKRIRARIEERYGMTISQFSKSVYPKKWGIRGENIPAYLSPSGNVSFPVLQVLHERLGLGTLEQRTKMIKRVTIFVSDND